METLNYSKGKVLGVEQPTLLVGVAIDFGNTIGNLTSELEMLETALNRLASTTEPKHNGGLVPKEESPVYEGGIANELRYLHTQLLKLGARLADANNKLSTIV